jgi:tetratricopeptide (TPR) repeat protein
MAELSLSPDQAAIIGLKIRESRLQLGLQQKDLVEGEFSKSYISLIESGRVMPSAKALKVIAQRLGFTVEQIINMATPGNPVSSGSEVEQEVFSRWDLVLDEARVYLWQHNPEQARIILAQRIKIRQLSSEQLKLYHFLLASINMEARDYEAAITEFKSTGQMAHSLGDGDMEARVFYRLGLIYFQQKKYMPAVEALRRANELVSGLHVREPKFKQQVCTALGDCYRMLGDQHQANNFYREGLELGNGLRDYAAMAEAAWDTSQSYREINNFAQAKIYTGKALALYEAVESLGNLAKCQAMLGVILVERKDHAAADKYLSEAFSLALQLGEKRLAATASLNLAHLFNLTDRVDDGLVMAEKSLTYANESGDSAIIGEALAKLAQGYAQKGDNSRACDYFVEAIEHLKAAAAQEVLSQTYYDYGQALSQLGRVEEALRAMEMAYNLQTAGRAYR